MIVFIEYAQTQVDEKSLTLFFDAPGDAWIRRQALIDVFGIKKSIVQKLTLPKAATQSPQGAYVIQWQQGVEFLMDIGISDAVETSLEQITQTLSTLPRESLRQPKLKQTPQGTALALRANVPQMPEAVTTAEDIAVYTENLRQLWLAEQQLREAQEKVKDFTGNSLPELPKSINSFQAIKTYARKLFDMWVADAKYRDAHTHFQTQPTDTWIPFAESPQTSEENGTQLPKSTVDAIQQALVNTIGRPLDPDIVDLYEGEPDALEREYDALVNYIVRDTGQSYGVVKTLGYKRLSEVVGTNFEAANVKPIEIIRKKGWWKQSYRALWDAYRVGLRQVTWV